MFDTRVVDNDTHSYCCHASFSVFSSVERDKKQKYSQVCQDCRATFTSLCVLFGGVLGCEATAFLKWIGNVLLAKQEMSYGTVMGWVCARLSFAILHATLMCFGSLVLYK